MGSKKFPSEKGFDAVLKKHGGHNSASTDCERTIFQFITLRKSFKEALDRLGKHESIFFVFMFVFLKLSPLLKGGGGGEGFLESRCLIDR